MSPAFMIAIANKQLTDNAAGRMLYFFHVRIDDDRSLRDHPRFAPWQPIRPINQQSNLGISNPTWAPSSLVLSSARGRWLPSIWPSPTGTRTTVEDAKSRSASESRRSAIFTCAGVTILGARNFISPSYHIGFKAIVNTNGRIAARRLRPLGPRTGGYHS
jgi:hypothetical protein